MTRFHEYPCQYCPTRYRSSDMAMAARLLLKHEQEHRHAVIMNISTGGRPEQGAISKSLVIVMSGLGLFGWGFSHGSRTPDGRWIAAVAIVGLAVLLLSTGVVRYRRRERLDAEQTKEIESRLQGDTTGAHIWDAV